MAKVKKELTAAQKRAGKKEKDHPHPFRRVLNRDMINNGNSMHYI
jgi:site-specific recombinase XerD